MKIKLKPLMIWVAAVSMTAGTFGYFWYRDRRPPILEIYVIPLKSGQSIFVRTPSDRRILIDGGANAEIIRDLSDILPFYSRKIDMVIITKADEKHTSGLIDVVNRYAVGELVVPGVSLVDLGLASSTDQIYATLIGVAKARNVPVKKVVAGDTLILDKTADKNVGHDVLAHILFPTTKPFKYSKASGPEIVARIEYGSTSVMLAGSVTPKIQKFLVAELATSSLKSDILVLSQSATSTNLAKTFMEKVSPSRVVYAKKSSKDPRSILRLSGL